MQARNHGFTFDPDANIATESVFNIISEELVTFPPVAGNFELLNGTPFLLLNGSNFLLL
jgi:hypothetical protein